MSTLKVTNLQHASSASANLTTDASGNVSSLGTIYSSSPMNMRNRIINGDMRIDQRNEGASQTITAAAALAYSVDRWYAYCTGANVTGQRTAGTAPQQYKYRFTGAASVTKIGFAQRLEAVNTQDMAGQTVTLSCMLANSLLTTVTWTAWYANTADTFGTLASPTRTQIATGTFTVNSTLTRYSTNISVGASATTGIEIELSVAAQTSGTWDIADVQLELGTVATPFERRDIGVELPLCQRYYAKSYNIGVALGTSTAVGAAGLAAAPYTSGTLTGRWYVGFPVRMRTTPTLTSYSTTGASGKVRDLQNGADVNPTLSNQGEMGFQNQGSSSGATTTMAFGHHWTAAIEL